MDTNGQILKEIDPLRELYKLSSTELSYEEWAKKVAESLENLRVLIPPIVLPSQSIPPIIKKN